MRDETSLFLRYLLARSESLRATTRLTLTAIHPDRLHHCPSRHVPIDDSGALSDAIDQLFEVNALGWGGYLAVGLRRPRLGRWRRGGFADIAALPALFVDVDDSSVGALHRLRDFDPIPSCIVDSGGGFHAYWWLDEPTSNVGAATSTLRGLSQNLGGDLLSIAHSLRLPGTINTKPERAGARCHLIDLRDESYPFSRFESVAELAQSNTISTPRIQQSVRCTPSQGLNANLIDAVARLFAQQGYRQRGDWLNGPCIYPEHHRHRDRHTSFGFNTRTGYGFCYVCGSMLLKELCDVFGLRAADYGGICSSN